MATLMEILDTAVKIGLGAIISGASGYWIARLNHEKDAEKDRRRRRRELLESIAEGVEHFNQSALRHYSLLTKLADLQAAGETIPQALNSEVEKKQTELFDAFKELTSAEAKLLLLGEMDCYKFLKEYADLIEIYEAKDLIGEDRLTLRSLNNKWNKMHETRKAFFNCLSQAYKQDRA